MTKCTTLWLALYGIVMLGYGAGQMTHDLLHYLDARGHTHLHHHAHGQRHHHFGDHTRIFAQYLNGAAAAESPVQVPTSTPINFFLFIQQRPVFNFHAALQTTVSLARPLPHTSPLLMNVTPPPEV